MLYSKISIYKTKVKVVFIHVNSLDLTFFINFHSIKENTCFILVFLDILNL